MLVPVRGDAPNATTPADHPGRGGLVMVDTSSDGLMYFSREDAAYNTMKDAQDKRTKLLLHELLLKVLLPQTQLIMLLMLQPHKLLLMLYQQAMLNLKRVAMM